MPENTTQEQMNKRSHYLKSKLSLIAQLGGKCVKCSSVQYLQFDCVRPAGREHHGLGQYDRMRFYQREAVTGNLQLLCAKCHARKSVADKLITRARRDLEMLERSMEPQQVLRAEAIGRDHLRDREGAEPSASDWEAWVNWYRRKVT
jgi:hypothetical protein